MRRRLDIRDCRFERRLVLQQRTQRQFAILLGVRHRAQPVEKVLVVLVTLDKGAVQVRHGGDEVIVTAQADQQVGAMAGQRCPVGEQRLQAGEQGTEPGPAVGVAAALQTVVHDPQQHVHDALAVDAVEARISARDACEPLHLGDRPHRLGMAIQIRVGRGGRAVPQAVFDCVCVALEAGVGSKHLVLKRVRMHAQLPERQIVRQCRPVLAGARQAPGGARELADPGH